MHRFRTSATCGPLRGHHIASHHPGEPARVSAAGLVVLGLGIVLAAPPAAASPRLSLQDVLREARAHNPTILAARERARAAAAIPARVSAWDDPVVSWETWNAPDPVSIDRADNNIFRLSQKIPFPGKRGLMGEAATRDAESAGRSAQAVELDVLAEVARAFWSLWQSHQRLAVFERDQVLLQRYARVAEQRYALGEVPQADVLRAQLERSHAETRLASARYTVESDRAALNALMSRAPDGALDIPEDPTLPALAVSLARLITDALERRPEIAAQDATIEREEAAVRLAKKSYLPDFEVSVGRFVNHRERDGVGAMASMTVPLAFKGKYDAGVSEASARLAAARADRRRLEDMIRRDVHQAFARVQSTLLEHSLFVAAHIPQAEQTLRVTESAYQTGSVDFLALLDTVRAIEEAHLDHIQAAAEAGKAYADLERATATVLGGGEEAP